MGVEDPTDFLDEENWAGSHITLAIQLGPSSTPIADERALRALRAIWKHPSLEGPYRSRWLPLDRQDRVPAVPSALDEPEHLYGLATLTDDQQVVCFTVLSRGSYGDGCDWLALCLPSGALGRVGVNADHLPTLPAEELRHWRQYMDTWFVPIAAAVHLQAPFLLAVLGEEAPVSAPWLPDGPFDGTLPSERTGAYVVPGAAGAGVEYHGPP